MSARRLLVILMCLFSVAPVVAQDKAVKEPAASSDTAICSYYSFKYNGRRTASGQTFSNSAMTPASRTYDFGTKLKLTNVKNGKSRRVASDIGRLVEVGRSSCVQLDLPNPNS